MEARNGVSEREVDNDEEKVSSLKKKELSAPQVVEAIDAIDDATSEGSLNATPEQETAPPDEQQNVNESENDVQNRSTVSWDTRIEVEGVPMITDDERQSSERKHCKKWGGSMYKAIKDADGSLDIYSDECLTLHGLQQSFDARNGWCRTVFYAVTWLALGVGLIIVFLPVIQEYQDRDVTYNYELESRNTSQGMPLPVVTVCPHGSGVQCNCLLWRAMHCRYTKLKKTEWIGRFDEWSCWTNFKYNRRDGFYEWDDPQCSDFDNGSDWSLLMDPCGPGRYEGLIEQYPINEPATARNGNGNLQEHNTSDFNSNAVFDPDVIPTWLEMYDIIAARETTSDEGPFITWEELITYSGRRIDGDLRFYRNSEFHQEQKPVPETWVSGNFLEETRFQICTQVRPRQPLVGYDDSRQRTPGSAYGILMVANNISLDRYPLRDISVASASLDVHVKYDASEGRPFQSQTVLHTERNGFLTIAAGYTTTLEIQMETLSRLQGWGSYESRNCQHVATPRSICIHSVAQNLLAQNCNCTSPLTTLQETPSKVPQVLQCSMSSNTTQYKCLSQTLGNWAQTMASVPITTCPYACESYELKKSATSSTKLSDVQILHLEHAIDREIKDSEQALVFAVGFGSFFVEKAMEQPSTTLGSLLSQLGGLLGLWCGLSISLLIEHMEYLIIAVMFGTGCKRRAARRRRNLTDRVYDVTERVAPSTESLITSLRRRRRRRRRRRKSRS